MAAASAAVCWQRDTIHMVTEVDVSVARRAIRDIRERTGESLSFTAYLVACLARVIAENPEFNAMISCGRLVYLDEITIGVLVEREIDGERVPEPVSVRAADRLTPRQLHDRLRSAQQAQDSRLGGLSGATWVRFVPSVLFKTMIRLASRSVRVARRYGVISVTSVGMFCTGVTWLVPLSASTVAMAVGGIVKRPCSQNGEIVWHEHVCLTLSFDHDIVDGAPAARFCARLSEAIASGEVLTDAAHPSASNPRVNQTPRP